MSERNEALMRIIVAIISGVILGIWRGLVQLLVFFHWIVVLVTGERIRGISEFCHIWNLQMYAYLKYLTFVTNTRPFPFADMVAVNKKEIE